MYEIEICIRSWTMVFWEGKNRKLLEYGEGKWNLNVAYGRDLLRLWVPQPPQLAVQEVHEVHSPENEIV